MNFGIPELWRTPLSQVTSKEYGWRSAPLFSRNPEGKMVVLWWIIVGLIAGWATGKIMRGSGYGALADILLGIAGALVGGWIMRALGGTGQGGMIYTILIAIVGAVVLTAVFRAITGRGKTGGTGGIRRAA